MVKHTPEPWIPGGTYRRVQPDRRLVGQAFGETSETAQANARLQAAAPKLLAALHAFVDYHEGDFPYEEEDAVDGHMPEMANAMAAIADATGETPVPPDQV
jgi:hypothetical protein